MDMLVNYIAYAVLLSSACALNGNETAVRRVLHVYSVPGYDVEEVATAVEQTIDSSGSHRHNLTVEFEEVEDIGVSINFKLKMYFCCYTNLYNILAAKPRQSWIMFVVALVDINLDYVTLRMWSSCWYCSVLHTYILYTEL